MTIDDEAGKCPMCRKVLTLSERNTSHCKSCYWGCNMPVASNPPRNRADLTSPVDVDLPALKQSFLDFCIEDDESTTIRSPFVQGGFAAIDDMHKRGLLRGVPLRQDTAMTDKLAAIDKALLSRIDTELDEWESRGEATQEAFKTEILSMKIAKAVLKDVQAGRVMAPHWEPTQNMFDGAAYRLKRFDVEIPEKHLRSAYRVMVAGRPQSKLEEVLEGI